MATFQIGDDKYDESAQLISVEKSYEFGNGKAMLGIKTGTGTHLFWLKSNKGGSLVLGLRDTHELGDIIVQTNKGAKSLDEVLKAAGLV